MGTELEEINTAGQTKSSDLLWLLVRLSGRVTFDHRKGPSPSFFFFFNKKTKNKKTKKSQFADWLIELANRGFGFSTDAFLKSVKKFLDKEARTIPFKTASQESVFGVSSFFLIPSPFIKLSPNIQF